MALLQLCCASILSPSVIGTRLDHPLYRIGSPHNLPDLISNVLVVSGAWKLVAMVDWTDNLKSPWRQRIKPPWRYNAPAALFILAMVLTYADAPRMKEFSNGGLLSTTGAGAKTYIALYAAAIILAAVEVYRAAHFLQRDARTGGRLQSLSRPLIVAAALAVAYGVAISAAMWFDADDEVIGHRSYVQLSWWLATIALIVLAIAGVTGIRQQSDGSSAEA